jgi:hypothetical protein
MEHGIQSYQPKKKSRFKTVAICTLAVIIGFGIALTAFSFMPKEDSQTHVLSSQDSQLPTKPPSQTPSIAKKRNSSATPTKTLKTEKVTIALFGDSMIDTMGDNVDALSQVLSRKYPSVTFTFYNYGIGAQNAEAGLSRFDSPYVYFKRDYPPVSSIKPDILIIGSFSYNPFNPHNSSRHIENLTALLNKAKQTDAKVYLLVEIAPLSEEFGRGENGVNMTPSAAAQHASHIQENLEDSLKVARSVQVPVIDAYTGSKTSETEGTKAYVNPDDGIHPSYEGHLYTADQIAKTIKID